MHEIIQGLEYIHRLGIVHRDVKPGNLLVTSEYTIVSIVSARTHDSH